MTHFVHFPSYKGETKRQVGLNQHDSLVAYYPLRNRLIPSCSPIPSWVLSFRPYSENPSRRRLGKTNPLKSSVIEEVISVRPSAIVFPRSHRVARLPHEMLLSEAPPFLIKTISSIIRTTTWQANWIKLGKSTYLFIYLTALYTYIHITFI